METYSLADMLIFLRAQQLNRYHGLDAIFAFMDNENIPDKDKMTVLISVLQELGLHGQKPHTCN